MTGLGAPRKSLIKIKDSTLYYPHQTEGIRLMARLNSFLLADEMGLGKSLQALTVAAVDWELGRARRGIIVSPATLKWNWEAEIHEHTNFSCMVLDGTPKKREAQLKEFLDKGIDWLIVNYEQVPAHYVAFNKADFDIGIFDEAHYLKNRKSKRTEACLKLVLARAFLLTGSPILNNVQELWTMFRMIDAERFPNYWRFVNRYAVFGGFKNKQVVGLKNVDELNVVLAEYMVRRLKTDVLDLPEKQYIKITLDLTKEQRQLYDQAKEELKIDLPGDPQPMELENALTKMLRLKQICGTTACIPGMADHSAKLDRAEEMIEEITTQEPVVVMTQFRQVQASMVARLEARGITCFVLNGDTPQTERRAVVDAWSAFSDEHGSRGALVAMLQVAGVGLTMTAASKLIMLDKLYVPKLNEQAVDRIHRIGASKTKPVQIYELICRNTIESRIEQILRLKDKIFGAVVEDADWKKALYAAIMEEDDL